MIDYAEVIEKNGAIVALDQEKAYDKIEHGYLWKDLKKCNLLQHFIKTIRTLYENAESVIMINRVISSKFKITRMPRRPTILPPI